MKLKKEYLILIVVIIGLVLYLTMRSANHDSELPQPAKLESSKINRLVITVKEKKPIELIKKDEQWIIDPQGYKADNVKVKNMINAVADLTLTALVSESGNYERYGLTPKEKTVVQAYSEGKVVRVLDIGRAAPTFQHTFVLLKDDPRVYHARGQFERTFDQTIESLRDKTIFDVDKESITTITLSRGEQSLTLTKKEIKPEEKESTQEGAGNATDETAAPAAPPRIEWQKADGQAVDKGSVERIIGGLSKLTCDSYMEGQSKTKLSDAVWTAAFKTAQNKFTLSVFGKENEKADKMPATASTTPYAFYLTKWRVDQFEASTKNLLGIKEKKDKT